MRTYKFSNGRKFKVCLVESIEGVTDTTTGEMDILKGNDFKALHSAMHEAMEGAGFCDKCIHTHDGYVSDRSVDVARFLWRLGYRKI